eukprot:564603-Amphidinium_carterae.1
MKIEVNGKTVRSTRLLAFRVFSTASDRPTVACTIGPICSQYCFTSGSIIVVNNKNTGASLSSASLKCDL